MQITKKLLKQIISEEAEKISESSSEMDSLLESYMSDYGSDDEYVSKQAMMDLLEVIEETKIPKEALEMFINYLPEQSVNKVLKEVVEND